MAGMRYQPQGRIEVDRLNPIALGLVGAFIASNPTADIFGAAVRLIGGLAPVATPVGFLIGGFSANQGIYAEIDQPLVSGAFSVAFTVLFYRRSGTQAFVAQGGSGTGNGWAITNSANSDSLLFILGGVASYTISNSALVSGQINRVVVRISGNGGTARAWVNGALVGTVGVGTMRTPASSRTLMGVAKQASAYVDPVGFRSAVGDQLLYNRALSDEEGVALSSNPYQIFFDSDSDDYLAPPAPNDLKVKHAEFAFGGGLVRTAVSRRMRVASASLAAAAGVVSMRATRRFGAQPAALAVVGWGATLRANRRLPATLADLMLTGGQVSVRYTPAPSLGAYTLPVSVAAIVLANGGIGVRAARRLEASPAVFAVAGGAVRITYTGEQEDIDAFLVPARHTVVFEGSRRVVTFEGAQRVVAFEGGKRVVSFEGSKRLVEFQ